MKTLLALESVWTVSFNGREFLRVNATDITVNGNSIRLGGAARVIESISWLRPNVARVHARPRFRSRPDVLTFYPGERPPHLIITRGRRLAFQRALGSALVQFFGEPVHLREIARPGKKHGMGPAYLRLDIGARRVIAVSPEEDTPVINGIMRAAVLWASSEARRAATVVVVPAERRSAIAARLARMPRLMAAFRWLQWDGKELAELDHSAGPVETHVDERRSPGAALEAEAARIVSIRPDLLRAFPGTAGNSISVRMRGLEVARVTGKETRYPLGASLGPLITDLAQKRRYGSRHRLARLFEERWLESSLIDQIDRVLPSVDRRHIYPQVPTFTGQERHTVDLLTVTRQGRLAVIEIKVGADPELPFQALDYWLAVERHRKAGDFASGGYFEGVVIEDSPALLVVVAPLLSFHRTFDRLADLFPEEAPLVQIGIAESWKKELQVLRRKGSVE